MCHVRSTAIERAFLAAGMKTMCLRIDRGQENCMVVAKYLANHPLVTKVPPPCPSGPTLPPSNVLLNQFKPIKTGYVPAGETCHALLFIPDPTLNPSAVERTWHIRQ